MLGCNGEEDYKPRPVHDIAFIWCIDLSCKHRCPLLIRTFRHASLIVTLHRARQAMGVHVHTDIVSDAYERLGTYLARKQANCLVAQHLAYIQEMLMLLHSL